MVHVTADDFLAYAIGFAPFPTVSSARSSVSRAVHWSELICLYIIPNHLLLHRVRVDLIRVSLTLIPRHFTTRLEYVHLSSATYTRALGCPRESVTRPDSDTHNFLPVSPNTLSHPREIISNRLVKWLVKPRMKRPDIVHGGDRAEIVWRIRCLQSELTRYL